MNKKAKHKRYSTRELEEKSVKICLNCPMADCRGSASCGYLRSQLEGKEWIAAEKADAEKKPAKKRVYSIGHHVEYEGKLYTLRQMAEMSGESVDTTKNRYIYGWTGKEMMQGHRDKKAKPEDVKGKPRNVREKYECNGQYYTVREMSEICGVSATAIYRRLRCGWTIGEILQNHRDGCAAVEDVHEAYGKKKRVFEYEGREYTYEELAEICGKSKAAVKRRLYRGWTIKEILQNHRDGKKNIDSQRRRRRRRMKNRIPVRNPSGNLDPTAHDALTDIQREQNVQDARLAATIRTLKSMIDLAGYDLMNRIELRDRLTGKKYL